MSANIVQNRSSRFFSLSTRVFLPLSRHNRITRPKLLQNKNIRFHNRPDNNTSKWVREYFLSMSADELGELLVKYRKYKKKAHEKDQGFLAELI